MLLALIALGCQPELRLTVPEDPLSGEVEVSVQGNFDRLVLMVDGIVLNGGDGPVLSADWDTTDVDDGPHQIRGMGYEGNRDPIEEVLEVEVDQVAGDDVAPDVAFTRPGDGQEVGGDNISISVSITEAVGLDSVVLYADGEILSNLPSEGPYEVAWEGVMTGEHTLEAEAVDLAGNVGTDSITITVGEESSEVTCSITSPPDGAEIGGEFLVKVAASASGGVDRVDFFMDGADIGSDEDSPWELLWDTTPYIGSEIELSIEVTASGGGLCTDTSTVTIVKPTENPDDFLVELTQPADKEVIPSTSTAYPIKARIGGGEGPESATLYINDVSQGTLTDATTWQWNWNASTYAGQSGIVLEVVAIENTTGLEASDFVTVSVSE